MEQFVSNFNPAHFTCLLAKHLIVSVNIHSHRNCDPKLQHIRCLNVILRAKNIYFFLRLYFPTKPEMFRKRWYDTIIMPLCHFM